MPSRIVPNPNCCTNPRYLCPQCSTTACKAVAVVANSHDGLFRRQKVDPKDVLLISKIDWTLNQSHQTKYSDCGCSRKAHVTNVRVDYPEDSLLLPKIVW